jgi:hypothetical protein
VINLKKIKEIRTYGDETEVSAFFLLQMLDRLKGVFDRLFLFLYFWQNQLLIAFKLFHALCFALPAETDPVSVLSSAR